MALPRASTPVRHEQGALQVLGKGGGCKSGGRGGGVAEEGGGGVSLGGGGGCQVLGYPGDTRHLPDA